MGWRDFCVGAVSGGLLSIARPPAGITLEEWMTPSGERQALWRAGALIVVALGLISERPRRTDARFPATEIALGATFGFALHGLVLVDLFSFDSSTSWLFALAAGLTAMLALRPKAAGDGVGASDPIAPMIQRLGLALCGAGLALVFAALNSRLCLFGAGTREDDTIASTTALLLFGVAALAFSPLFARRQLSPAWYALGLGVAAVLALPSFDFLGTLSQPPAYTEFLRRFQLDSTWRGSISCDALLAARAFALPALIAGIAFASLRSASSIGWTLLGAAIASVLAPHWRGGFSATTLETVAAQASTRAAHGASIAALGVLIHAITGARSPWKTRAGFALCAVICLVGSRFPPRPLLVPLSPWERIEPHVEWIRETPEGLLTVELQGGRGRIATLDRRRLTPTIEESPAEELRLRASIPVLPDREVRLAGLLTPERAILLRVLGVSSVWIQTAWKDLDQELQTALFAGSNLPDGLGIDRGGSMWDKKENDSVGFDVVTLAPPVETASRTTVCLDTGDHPPLSIGWLPAHQDIARLDWGSSPMGERVLVSCSHIDDLSIGVIINDSANLPDRCQAGSRSRFGTLAQLLRPLPEREKTARMRVAERLVRGEATPATRALLLLCSTQESSSPFETRAQRTELDPQALEILVKVGLAAEPRGFERELDEFVAATLEGQRNLDGLLAFAQPLADAHPAWPKLQRAAARADWEFMHYSDAAHRLERVVEATPYDLHTRLWLAESLLRADDPAGALKAAEAMLAIQSDRFDAERLRAIAAARAGDPRAGSWIGALLRDHPDDADLAAHAKAAPFPPLSPPLGVPGEAASTEHH